MKDIVNLIMDRIFSFGTLIAIIVALFFFLIIRVGQNEKQEREELRLQVAACYNIGMVRVESDAGPRCALPANLPAIK